MVQKRKMAAKEQKEEVVLTKEMEGEQRRRVDRLEARTEEGRRKGWKKVKGKGRTVQRGVQSKGQGRSRRGRKRRSKGSRERVVGREERWRSKGKEEVYRRRTTKGVRTAKEAMKRGVGGKRRRVAK